MNIMSLNLKEIEVGDLVSEIENHTNLNEHKDCIHLVKFIQPFPHGRYFEIGLSGYTTSDEQFSEFELYPLP